MHIELFLPGCLVWALEKNTALMHVASIFRQLFTVLRMPIALPMMILLQPGAQSSSTHAQNIRNDVPDDR